MEMTRSILKHMQMPNYMWGEATRHSTYLLNRIATRAVKDRTPYEVCREKKPNISHLRTFGCIGYAKTVKPHLRKLEDRSSMLVHLGTEPGTKGYRMYEPNTQKIKVSREVVFDESKGWNWSKTGSEQSQSGTFVVGLGEFGNHGLEENPQVKVETDEEASNSEITPHDEEEDEVGDTEKTEEDLVNNDNEVILRRSQRQSVRPKYLEDYVLLTEEEGEYVLMCLDDEPKSFAEAKDQKNGLLRVKTKLHLSLRMELGR